MAGTFEVGSILARLKLDDSAWVRGIGEAIDDAKVAGRKIKEFLKKGEKLVLDNRGFKTSLGAARTLVNVFVKGAKAAFATVGPALKKSVQVPLAAIRATLKALTFGARSAGRALKAAFRGVGNVLRRLRRFAMSFQGALAGIGLAFSGFSLIQRARDVEVLERAFQNLAASVGGVADSFLGKLRNAVRGTVSDLDLMRTTNNAVLLGVVKSEDEFSELAAIARRLGQAVGRDTVDAINDLSIGIGRQSRLILDNLGLIVKISEATETYATQLGKNVNNLTDAERRQAFFNAAMEAGRKKVKELGPDVRSITDSWGYFTAQISNTINTFARAFVGGGIFESIATFLDRNSKKISAFANFVSRVFSSVIKELTGIFAGLTKATGIEEFLAEATRLVVDGITFMLDNAAKLLLIGIRTIFSNFSVVALKLVLAVLAQIGVSIIGKIREIINSAVKFVLDQLIIVGSKIPLLNKILGIDDPKKVRTALEANRQVAEEEMKRIAAFIKSQNEEIEAIVSDTIVEVGVELKAVAEDLAEVWSKPTMTSSQNKFVKAVEGSLERIGEAFKRMKLDIADPFADFTTLRVQRELIKVGNAFTKIVQLRQKVIAIAPELISEDDLAESGARLKKFEGLIGSLSEAFTKLKSAPDEVQDELKDSFLEIFAKVQEALQENSREVERFAATVTGRMEDIGDIEKPEKSIVGIGDAILHAAEQITGANPKIAELTKRLEEVREVSRSLPKVGDLINEALRPTFFPLEEFNKLISPFVVGGERFKAIRLEVETAGLTEAEKELVKFDDIFRSILDQLSPEARKKLEETRAALAKMLDQREGAKRMEEAEKALKQFDQQLEQVQDNVNQERLGDLAVQLDVLGRSLREALISVPVERADEVRNKFRQMAGALGEAELVRFTSRLLDLEQGLEDVGKTDLEVKLQGLAREFDTFRIAIERASGLELPEASRLLKEFGRNVVDFQALLVTEDFENAMETLRDEVQRTADEMKLLATPEDERRIAEVTLELEEMREELLRNAQAMLAHAEAAGTDKERLEELKAQVQALIAAFDAQAAELVVSVKLSEDTKKAEKESKAAAEAVGQVFENAIGGALTNALRKGESVGKQWSEVLANFFADAMENAIKQLGKFITSQLSGVFKSLGIGEGVGGMLTGVLGVAGLIYNSIRSRGTTTVEDFSSAVNSSEAVRGVVAGPSNVAISKVGDSLKQALRTSEILLERIAIAVETGGGVGAGPSGGGDLSGNAAPLLSTSTAI
ncbi:MAG: hypothetical protein JSW58_08365 [Candidatus Latescibacterota bacterium]|nr:MAG: hypothetical protein JSW58_08365 [Candidatus Latescibacterota bacterium]